MKGWESGVRCERQRGVDRGELSKPSHSAASPHVGSLARLRKRQTFSIEPFSSKSCLKKRAVSLFTCGGWVGMVSSVRTNQEDLVYRTQAENTVDTDHTTRV